MSTGPHDPVVAPVLARATSPGWGARPAAAAVIVSTHGRSGYLSGLLQHLDAQDHQGFEVVVVDNGSHDETWQVLTRWLEQTAVPALGLKVSFCDGPAVPRNTAVAHTAAPVLAFTDDDCLPADRWVRVLTQELVPGVAVVQGQTRPEAGAWEGPWGRSLSVQGLTGLYETANLACRRADFVAAGGFSAERLLTGRAFGEDVLLGSALARTGRAAFCPEALVEHRVLPGSYRDFLRERHRLQGFPLLRKAVPELGERAYLGVFLSRRTATVDLGAGAVLAALLLRRPAALLGALPWALASWRSAEQRWGHPTAVGAAQLAAADVVSLVGLAEGSARARKAWL